MIATEGGIRAGGFSGAARPMLVARFELVLTLITAALTIGLGAYKLVLARWLNVNWDEFFFLSHVYSLSRHELTIALQTAYTHLFTWLEAVPGNEMDQVFAGRLVMVLLLWVTAYLIWRVSRLWLTGFASWLPSFMYLSAMPVLEHGGSFRADSLLAPLSMGALVALLGPRQGPRRDYLAGLLLGVAFAATVKVALFGPLILAVVVFRRRNQGDALEWREIANSLVRLSMAAGITAMVLIGLHLFSIASAAGSITDAASASARKTLFDTPWFPRLDYFLQYVRWQPFPWVMIGIGALIALFRRRFAIAALALSLLPLVFYRNAFPYYYVVMLAPASILAGFAITEIWTWVRPLGNTLVTTGLIFVLWLGFPLQGYRSATLLAFDDQSYQREMIAAVHQIFPEPVNYIDRCGMISSFRKVNFFMSSWGVENYRARNEPFMPTALVDYRPAFVLWNTPSLTPANTGRYGPLERDRELLLRYYIHYWGPVFVAGSRGRLDSDALTITVPFPASYRLVVPEPVLIDGELRNHGAVIVVTDENVAVTRPPASSGGPIPITLVLASAQTPPALEPDRIEPFRGF